MELNITSYSEAIVMEFSASYVAFNAQSVSDFDEICSLPEEKYFMLIVVRENF